MLKARFFDKFKTLLISLVNLAESCELFSTSCTGWKFRIEAQESCRVSDYPTLGQLFKITYFINLLYKVNKNARLIAGFSHIVRISSWALIAIDKNYDVFIVFSEAFKYLMDRKSANPLED